MKKFVLTLLCAVGITLAANAAGGGMAFGVNMAHASWANQMGIGAKFQCELVDAFRVEPSFNYYFENANWRSWDVNVDFHYVVNVSNKFDVYPLAGLGYSNWKYDLGENTTYNQDRFVFNLGAGGEVALTERIALTAELRYQLMKDFGQLDTMVGVKYRF